MLPPSLSCAQRLAEALLDDAVLAREGAADARELGRGVVGEGAVGLDLAAERAQQVAEVVLEQRSGEGFDAGQWSLRSSGGVSDELAPGLDALGVREQREEFGGFERGALDAGLIEQIGGVEQAAEVEGCRRSRQGGASRRCAAAAGRSSPRRRRVRVPAPGRGQAGSGRRRRDARAGVPTRARRRRARLAGRECSGCRPQSSLEPIVAYRVEPIVPRPAARG